VNLFIQFRNEPICLVLMPFRKINSVLGNTAESDNIIERARLVIESSNELLICSTFGGLQMDQSIIFDSIKKVLDKHKKR
jgi:hypothetical protein